MTERIVVLGCKGQLGSALLKLLGPRAVGLSRDEADLSRPSSLGAALERARPTAVINTAAYNQVDLAEKETELAFRVNAESPGELARWCFARGVPFVHYSTDYVFDGEGTKPWTETDPPRPLGAYGRSKLEGEKLAQGAMVFRTSWVFDSYHPNFVTTMARAAREKETLRVVADQRGVPTYAPDLARASMAALEKFQAGVFHLCGGGSTSRHGWAVAIIEGLRARGAVLSVKEIIPVSSAEFAAPAKRPLNSVLDPSLAREVFGVALPAWDTALRVCLEEMPR